MHKTCCLIIIVALFFSGVFSSIASAEIVVSPEKIHLYLTGGDTVTEQITITWEGETAVVAFIETEVTPDGEGIDITYSEDPVILYPDTPKTIDMTIATAINIAPGNYTITTLIFTEVEKWIEYRGGGTTTIYETIETENLTRINALLDIIWRLTDEINATKGNYTEHMSLLTAIINTLGELTDSIEDMLPQELEEKENGDKWLPFIAFLAIVYIILIVIMVRMGKRIRVLESQRIKEVNKNEPENK